MVYISNKQRITMYLVDDIAKQFGEDRWFVQSELHGITKHSMDALVEKGYLEILEWNGDRYYRRLKSMEGGHVDTC